MQDRPQSPERTPGLPVLGAALASASGAESIPYKAVDERTSEASAVLRRLATAAWPYALLLAVGLFVLLPKLGDYGFWDPWEPKYAESAREMLERESYVVPYYRGEVRLTKPILVYWGILAGAAVFGLNEFGARIAGVGFALVALAVAYYTVSSMRGRRAGLFAAVVLATVPQFYFIARQAMPDVYLFTTLGCSLLLFALGLYGPVARRNLHFGLAYAAFALAVLAKGPLVAGVIFFTTLAVHTVTILDLRLLRRPGVSGELTRVVATAAGGVVMLIVHLALSYVFGTSSMWWGYAAPQRLAVSDGRRSLLGAMNRIHGQPILLSAYAIGWSLLAFHLWRTRSAGGWARRSGAAAAAVAALLAIVGLFRDGESQILIAGVLGAAAGLAIVLGACARLLHHPLLGDAVRPWLAPIGRQALLFAVVFLVVAGPWHIAVMLDQSHGFVTDFIIKHNINRALDDVNSTGVSDFYLRTMTWGYVPWSAFIPVMLASLIAWSDRDALRRQGFEIYLMVALLVTFVAFTFSMTKFSHYLAPMVVPMAALIGITLARMTDRSSPWPRLGWLAAAMLFLLPAIDLTREGGVRYLVTTFTVKRWVPEELEPGMYITALLAAMALLMLVNVFLRSTVVTGVLLAVVVLFAHHYSTRFVPELSRHKSLKWLVEAYERHRAPGDPLGFHGDLKHGIFFYGRGEAELLGDNEEFMEFMAPGHHSFVILERTRYFKLRAPYQQRYQGHDLHIIDDSHFDYNLVTNFPVPGAGNLSRSSDRGVIGSEED